MKLGFDAQKYIQMQSQHIKERRGAIGGKLYLEMGGKLFDDYHASRVLPGFLPDLKISMLEELKDDMEILIVLNAQDLVRNKIRSDLGISYEDDLLRLIDAYRGRGFLVEHVVMTHVEDDNSAAKLFRKRLKRLGIKVSRHFIIPGYPTDLDRVISEEGLGQNEFAQTTRDLVVVTAPGPGSGKLATCLSQIYGEYSRGRKAGYAKFETFPIWNLPLNHPVNLAYEAATADLDDVNMIDPFHLDAYGEQTVNYNRDVEAFPLLAAQLKRLAGESPYKSPTDMGVNMAGNCIIDDEACREAGKQEIIRRYFAALVEEKRKELEPRMSESIALLMAKVEVTPEARRVVPAARSLAEETKQPASAIELKDGTLIRGKTSELLGCSSAMLLNALKYLAGIDDDVKLLSPQSIEPIQTLKTKHLGSKNPRLHTDEVLIALSVSAAHSQNARSALAHLAELAQCDVHTTSILGSVDETIFRNLKVRVTSDPVYVAKTLYKKR